MSFAISMPIIGRENINIRQNIKFEIYEITKRYHLLQKWPISCDEISLDFDFKIPQSIFQYFSIEISLLQFSILQVVRFISICYKSIPSDILQKSQF